MSNVADILLTITGDSTSADKALDEVSAKLVDFNKKEARAKLAVDGADAAQRQIGELDAALTLIGHRNVTADVRVNVKNAQAQLKILGAELTAALSGGTGARPLDDVLADFAKLGSVVKGLNSGQSPLTDLTTGAKTAKLALRDVATQLIGINGSVSKAQIEVDGGGAAKKTVGDLLTALDGIKSRTDVTREIKIKTSSAESDLKRLGSDLEHALSGGTGARPIEDVTKDIGALGDTLAKVAEGSAGPLSNMLGQLADIGPTVGEAAAKVGSSLGTSLISGLTGLATTALSAGAAIALLGPVLLALAGVLGALVASLAAAAAGFGALLVGGIGALIPVALVAVIAIKNIVGAVSALSSKQKDAKQTTEQLRSATEAHTNALQQQSNAQSALSQATVAGYKAERDAATNLTDAELSLQEAKLGIQDANLALETAQLNLKNLTALAKDAGPAFGDLVKKFSNVDVNTDPKALDALVAKAGGLNGGTQAQIDLKQALLDVAHAQLGVAESKESDTKATNALSDAQQTNTQYTKEGIKAYQPYVDALQGVQSANQQVADSTTALSDQRAAIAATTSKYSKSELGLAQQILDVGKAAEKLLKPAEGPVDDGAVKLLQGISGLVKDPVLRTGLTAIGKAIGSVLAGFGGLLKTQGVKTALEQITTNASALVKVIGGPVFQSFFLILLHIAQVAGPPLLALFKRFGAFIEGVAKGTDNAKKLSSAVDGVVKTFTTWLEIAKNLAGIVLDFFKGAAGGGDHLADRIEALTKRWSEFLGTKKGQDEIQTFIQNSIDKVKKLGDNLGTVARVFNVIVEVLKEGYNILTFFYNLTQKMLEITGIKPLLQLIGGAAGTVAGGGGGVVGSVVRGAVGAVGSVLGSIGFASGGLVPGPGGNGDDQVHALEGGEYVVNRAVVRAVGVPALNALNAGVSAAAVGGSNGIHIAQQDVHLPAAPGHSQMGDARTQAAQFAAEMRRRGRGRGV